MRWSSGDYQIAPIAARSTAMGRWRLTPPGYGGTCLPAGRSVRGSDTPPACHSTPRTPQGEGFWGAAFSTANPSRGRLTEACHSTPRTPQGEGLGVRHSHREPLKGKANGDVSFNTATHQGGRLTSAGGGRKKDRRGRSFCFLFGCTAYWDLFCSFWSMAVNSGGRGQWSSTGSPVRGWTKRRPVAWRHWPVRPGTGFLAP